jgi:hypothetical protein
MATTAQQRFRRYVCPFPPSIAHRRSVFRRLAVQLRCSVGLGLCILCTSAAPARPRCSTSQALPEALRSAATLCSCNHEPFRMHEPMY